MQFRGYWRAHRVDGCAVDIAPLLGIDLAQAVDGPARARRTRGPASLWTGRAPWVCRSKRVLHVFQRDALGAFKHLEDHAVPVDDDDASVACLRRSSMVSLRQLVDRPRPITPSSATREPLTVRKGRVYSILMPRSPPLLARVDAARHRPRRSSARILVDAATDRRWEHRISC